MVIKNHSMYKSKQEISRCNEPSSTTSKYVSAVVVIFFFNHQIEQELHNNKIRQILHIQSHLHHYIARISNNIIVTNRSTKSHKIKKMSTCPTYHERLGPPGHIINTQFQDSSHLFWPFKVSGLVIVLRNKKIYNSLIQS